MFSNLCPFLIKIIMNMIFVGNQIGYILVVLTTKIVLLTFQIEQNEILLENLKYHYSILHKKLV